MPEPGCTFSISTTRRAPAAVFLVPRSRTAPFASALQRHVMPAVLSRSVSQRPPGPGRCACPDPGRGGSGLGAAAAGCTRRSTRDRRRGRRLHRRTLSAHHTLLSPPSRLPYPSQNRMLTCLSLLLSQCLPPGPRALCPCARGRPLLGYDGGSDHGVGREAAADQNTTTRHNLNTIIRNRTEIETETHPAGAVRLYVLRTASGELRAARITILYCTVLTTAMDSDSNVTGRAALILPSTGTADLRPWGSFSNERFARCDMQAQCSPRGCLAGTAIDDRRADDRRLTCHEKLERGQRAYRVRLR